MKGYLEISGILFDLQNKIITNNILKRESK